MLTLNLVSEEIKKEIRKRKIFSLFRGVLFFLTILTITITASIIYAKLVIELKMENIDKYINTVNQNSAVFNQKISKINSLIDFTQGVQAEFVPWSCLIKQLMDNDQGITFSAVNINKKTATLVIRGSAKTRDGLLAYSDKVENMDYFSDVKLPENILGIKENISFELTAKLVTDFLPKLSE